jgi:hypothetical protein
VPASSEAVQTKTEICNATLQAQQFSSDRFGSQNHEVAIMMYVVRKFLHILRRVRPKVVMAWGVVTQRGNNLRLLYEAAMSQHRQPFLVCAP